MPQFTFKGDIPLVFVDVADGDHTLLAVPGETYELIANPDDALFVAAAAQVAPKSAPVEAPQSAPEAPVAPSN
jgi:hypothetical protein